MNKKEIHEQKVQVRENLKFLSHNIDLLKNDKVLELAQRVEELKKQVLQQL